MNQAPITTPPLGAASTGLALPVPIIAAPLTTPTDYQTA